MARRYEELQESMQGSSFVLAIQPVLRVSWVPLGISKRKHMLAARLRYHPGHDCFHHGNQYSSWKSAFIVKTSFIED